MTIRQALSDRTTQLDVALLTDLIRSVTEIARLARERTSWLPLEAES